MTIEIYIGGKMACLCWSLANWYCYSRIFNARDINGKKVKDVIPYLDYRIRWLKRQGYDETNTEIDIWGEWSDPKRKHKQINTRRDLTDPRNDFVMKSKYLEMLMYLREKCEDVSPDSYVSGSDEFTDVDLVATREIINEPIGAFPLENLLKSQKVKSHLRRLVHSYAYLDFPK
jgi:hypothetical protein